MTDDISKTICLTLFRSFSREVGRVNATDVGKLFKTLEFDYAVDFGLNEGPSYALALGEQWRTGFDSVTTTKHEGILKSTQSLMRVGSLHNAIVSSCKAGDNNETIVRVYDVSGLEDTVEITFAATMLKAFKTDLLGNVMEELKVENNKVNLKLRGNEIATMKVLF